MEDYWDPLLGSMLVGGRLWVRIGQRSMLNSAEKKFKIAQFGLCGTFRESRKLTLGAL